MACVVIRGVPESHRIMFFSFFLLIDPYSHLRHWRCVLDFGPKHTAAEQRASKQPLLLFSMYTPTPAAAATRRPTTLHATVLFHSVAARKAPFSFLFFFFWSGDDYIPVDVHSVTLPMCARGGTCVIDAPRRCVGRVFCT